MPGFSPNLESRDFAGRTVPAISHRKILVTDNFDLHHAQVEAERLTGQALAPF
jgi:hypothetical protein